MPYEQTFPNERSNQMSLIQEQSNIKTRELTYQDAHELASRFLKQTKGGSSVNAVSANVRATIDANIHSLIEIGFKYRGVNFNPHGIRRMLLTYTKIFLPEIYMNIKQQFMQ
jgi:hypothetical protein